MAAWRWVVVLAVIPGCFFEMRGSSNTSRRPLHDDARSDVEGDLAFGLGYIDKQQAAVAEIGVGGSPLQSRDPMQPAPLLAIYAARYEHAIGTPWVRAYGRAMYGFNSCESSSDASHDPSCAGDAGRHISVTTVGAGIELTVAEDAKAPQLVGNVVGVGIGIVYQSVHDAMLGPGSFVGVELSLLMGGDLLTAISQASKKHD